MTGVWLTTLLLAVLPISELRGAIPYAVAHDIPLVTAALVSIGANALVPLFAALFLNSIHRLLSR
ncbi:MAG: small multi-drug export protein, partial [Spirochaetaceae bacterium]|nr:small multi-drug export protein [Spirochaetaceae bacterium]